MKADYTHKDSLTAIDYVELNKENKLLLMYNQTLLKENKQLKSRMNKGLNKINNMFDRGDGNTIIDDLLELEKIFKGSDNDV